MNPASSPRRLADDIELALVYADDTPFGGILSGKLVDTVRNACLPVFQSWGRVGGSASIARSVQLMQEVHAGELAELLLANGDLRSDALFPDFAQIRPVALLVKRGGFEVLRAALSPHLAGALARWIGDWANLATRPSDSDARTLYDALARVSAFTETTPGPQLQECDGYFIGHATVCVGNRQCGRVLVDPFLLPRSDALAASYQPIVPAQLGNVLAVCITHSHPDHFCLGSLLKLGADTCILVPRVARESVLSVAMAMRLKEIGFRNVRELEWGAEHCLGDTRITALPFYGEQPTVGARRHLEVRNEGNTYLIEQQCKRYLAVADSGRDADGDAIELAATLRAKLGCVDVLFAGHRAFPQYPIEYVFSSVPQYLLFVPEGGWLRRQKIMHDEHDMLDLAEAWQARHVVPYACGGAPWYWLRGLGPEPAGRAPANRCDPRPEAAHAAASFRTGRDDEPNASPVEVTILRPGDGFVLRDGKLQFVRQAPHAWPLHASVEQSEAIPPVAEPTASEPPHWLQVDLAVDEALEPLDDQLWKVLRHLAPLVDELKSRGDCRSFFIQCKPPGFRLRLELTSDAISAQEELRDKLARARAMGDVRGFAFGVYEPEWRVFGGHTAMHAIHRYFDADTALLIQRMALSRSTMPHAVATATEWLSLVTDDLVARVVRERGECWDVYTSLFERHGGASPEATLTDVSELVTLESRGERELFKRYCTANQRFAEDLETLQAAGELTVGRRAVATNVAQFQFNRYALQPEQQCHILRRLAARHEPTQLRERSSGAG